MSDAALLTALESDPAAIRARLDELANQISKLTPSQQEWVSAVIGQFQRPSIFWRNDDSAVVTPLVLETLGDALRVHHAFSRQALSKDRFEFALEKALARAGIKAELANSRTNRGHDITIGEAPISLKTEAASNIKEGYLHISKFMELAACRT